VNLKFRGHSDQRQYTVQLSGQMI